MSPTASITLASRVLCALCVPCALAPAQSPRRRTVEFYLPLAFGTRWRVMQGNDQAPTHNDKYNRYAIDFQMPVGTPVHAAAPGVVVQVKEDATGPTGKDEDNNKVVIRHADGTAAHYLHLRKDGAIVEVGDHVLAGDQIAWSGNTGRTGSPHLHFNVFSSYPGGVSIPSRFVDVPQHAAPERAVPKRAGPQGAGPQGAGPEGGVPKTGESPISLNYPVRALVGGIDWLADAWELCRVLDRRGALAKLLKSQVAAKRLPREIRAHVAAGARKGRKGLDRLFTARRDAFRQVCAADLQARVTALDAALAARPPTRLSERASRRPSGGRHGMGSSHSAS